MIRHYIKSAKRGALRNKQYLIINVLGLSIALATVILIGLFVRDELSYDKWLDNYESIYKVESTIAVAGSPAVMSAYTPGTMVPALDGNFDNLIDASTRIYRNETTARIGERQFNEAIDYVDATFFDVFNLPLISGDQNSALINSNSILISEATAFKYFGTSDPLGEIFNIDHPPSNTKLDYQVVGVFKNIPENSHLNSSFIALLVPSRYENWPWVSQDWNSLTNHSYFKLAEGITKKAVDTRLQQFSKTLPIDTIEGSVDTPRITFSTINVADLHLYSTTQTGFKASGDIVSVNTFALIALLILLMASINFTNLASVQAIKRSREVSIRKVLGASRRHLILQFLTESILTSLVAMIVGVAIVELILPMYNAFLGKNIALYPLTNPFDALILLSFTLFVGLAAGAYPAFVSSSFRPAKTLQSDQMTSPGSTRLRSILLIVQFTISISLIISVMIIYAQTLYSQNIDAGFDKENRLTLTGAGFDQVAPASHTLKQELAKIAGVSSVGMSSDAFPNRYNNYTDVLMPNQTQQGATSVQAMFVGTDFLQTYGITPVAGRSFSQAFATDFRNAPADETRPITRGAIINESLLSIAGFASAAEAIGQHLTTGRGRFTDVTIVGVIKNLHVGSTRQSPAPMIYFTTQAGLDFMTLELKSGDNTQTHQQIETVWKKLLPSVPMISTYTTDNFDALYDADNRRAVIFAIFAALSVFISSVGLYGLAAFIAESRTREIGIRKVLGATIWDIVKLLLLQFSKPIIIANFIAWPLAYLNMENWLSNFAYRIDISLAYFIFAGLVTLIIAWGVVGGHAIKVARTNPIQALRRV